MPRRKPKDFNLFTAIAELPERERHILGVYVYTRTMVKGCGPDDMTPEELMRFLTTPRGESNAA